MGKKIQLYWLFPLFVAAIIVAAVVIIDYQINSFKESYFSALKQEITLRNHLIIGFCKAMKEMSFTSEKMQSFFENQTENPFVLRIKKIGGETVFETASTPIHLRRILNVPRIRKIMRGPAENEVFFEHNPYFKTYFAYNAIRFSFNNEEYVLLMAEQCESVTRLVKLSEFAILVLSMVGAGIVCWLFFYFLGQVRSPLKRLKVSTRAIAGGNFDFPVYVPPSGVVREIALSVRDMAEHLRGQIVQLKKFEEQRREFFGAISHAMKTPLTGILSAVEGIEQGALENPEYRAECIKAIEIQSKRLSELLHDFLNLNNIELCESKKRKDFIPVYISELLAEASESFKEQPFGIKFNMSVPADEPEISGNQVLLLQAFENLFSNAYKHGDASEIKCSMTLNAEVMEILICDNGIGISPDEREKVFERFYRSVSCKKELVPGNGLGLVIVRRVISLHGGRVVIADGFEQWKTVFKITLPLK